MEQVFVPRKRENASKTVDTEIDTHTRTRTRTRRQDSSYTGRDVDLADNNLLLIPRKEGGRAV